MPRIQKGGNIRFKDCTAYYGGGAYVGLNVIQEYGVMEHLVIESRLGKTGALLTARFVRTQTLSPKLVVRPKPDMLCQEKRKPPGSH